MLVNLFGSNAASALKLVQLHHFYYTVIAIILDALVPSLYRPLLLLTATRPHCLQHFYNHILICLRASTIYMWLSIIKIYVPLHSNAGTIRASLLWLVLSVGDCVLSGDSLVATEVGTNYLAAPNNFLLFAVPIEYDFQRERFLWWKVNACARYCQTLPRYIL